MEWEDYWLKAKENLTVTGLAYHGKHYNACASRAYYAVYLASIAVLIRLTDCRAKDGEWGHSQVQAELNRRLIMRQKVLPSELGRTPMDLIALRHLADYAPQAVTLSKAKLAYERAEKFLAAIGNILGEPL